MFKTLLSQQWEQLNPRLQKHYGLKNHESITMQGNLSVRHGKWIKLLMPLIRITGALVPVEGENFKVTVKNTRIDQTYYWHRTFEKDGKRYLFKSKMQAIDGHMVEFVGLGIGIKMQLRVDGDRLIYEDKGYVLKLGNHLLPLPLNWLVGQSHIQEFVDNWDCKDSTQFKNHPNSENPYKDFAMDFQVHHPWFGFAFSYQGYFVFESS